MIRGGRVKVSEPVAHYLLQLLRRELASRAPDAGATGDESAESEMMRVAVSDLADGIQTAIFEAQVLAENDDKRAADEEERRAGMRLGHGGMFHPATRVDPDAYAGDPPFPHTAPSESEYKSNICDQQGRCWHRCDNLTCLNRCAFLFEPEERDILRKDPSVESDMIPHPHECFRCLNRRTTRS